MVLKFVIHASTYFLVACQQRGGGDMGRMSGVGLDISHRRDYGGQNHIPVFGRIPVESDLHRFQHVNLCGQFQQGFTESQGYLTSLLGSPCKFEHYYMFDHVW